MSKVKTCEQYVLERLEFLEDENIRISSDLEIVKRKYNVLYDKFKDVLSMIEVKKSSDGRPYANMSIWEQYDNDKFVNLIDYFNEYNPLPEEITSYLSNYIKVG